MLPKYRAELFEGKNTWHSSWRVVHLACLHSYVLLGLFLESRMCKLRWLCNVVYGVRLLCTARCVAPCTRSGCWVIEICCRCVWLHWGLGFTSSIDSFFPGKRTFEKAFKIFWNLWFNTPSCCSRSNRVSGRLTVARLQFYHGKAHMDISPYKFYIFIRWELFKDKNVHKSPRFHDP